jgi:ribonuclease I
MQRGRLLAPGCFLLKIVEFKAVSMKILGAVRRGNNQGRTHGLRPDSGGLTAEQPIMLVVLSFSWHNEFCKCNPEWLKI